MKAFHNDPLIKKKYLSRVRAHKKADEIIKGRYWEGGRGCAVGCTIHSSDHNAYEIELGIPEWLAQIEDIIFEGLPNEKGKLWPSRFLYSINVGADLNKIKAPLMIFILKSTLENFDHIKYPKCKKAVDTCINLWEKYPEGPSYDSRPWSAARYIADYVPIVNLADPAARSAYSAARSAAKSIACLSYTFSSDYYYYCDAALAVYFSADSDFAAALDATRYTRGLIHSETYAYRAQSAVYVKLANELLRLLKECK